MDPQYIYRELGTLESVLDVGCGYGTVIKSVCGPKRRVGVDAFPAAIERARRFHPDVDFRVLDVRHLSRQFEPNTMEGVVGFDIVEHLSRPDAIELLKTCEGIAKKMIWWFVPIGNHPQGFDPRNEGNESLQMHRSVWQPQDFTQRGYDVWYYDDWHQKQKGQHAGKSMEAAFCRKLIGKSGGLLYTCHRYLEESN